MIVKHGKKYLQVSDYIKVCVLGLYQIKRHDIFEVNGQPYRLVSVELDQYDPDYSWIELEKISLEDNTHVE